MNVVLLTLALLGQINHPITYVRAPLNPAVPSFFPQSFSEQGGPYVFHPGTQLVYLAADGTERVVATDVHDHCMSLDGQSVFYSQVVTREGKRTADLYRVPVVAGPPELLVTSNPGDFATAPCDTPEGLVFCSDRDGIKSPGENFRAHQLYILDDKGERRIDFMNFGGVLHPFYHDGWVYFATAQQQGLRTRNGGGWTVWRMRSDGSSFEPWISAIPPMVSFGWHRLCITTDGTTVAEGYYDTRGIGTLFAFPKFEATPFGPPTMFGKPGGVDNPFIWVGVKADTDRPRQSNITRFPFQPRGMFNPMPWSLFQDVDNIDSDGEYQREIGHPAATPGNRGLFCWTGNKPTHRDLGIYITKRPINEKPLGPGEGVPSSKPLDYLDVVVDSPDWHEWDAKAAVPYSAIYGQEARPAPASPKADLDPASPYGVIGSSGVWDPEVIDDSNGAFYSTQKHIDNSRVHSIRIVGFTPTMANINISPAVSNQTPAMGTGPQTSNREGFLSAVNERMTILGEIPLLKWITPEGKMHVGDNPPEGSTPLMRSDGQRDTSWQAETLGFHAWSFQLLDAQGRVIPLSEAKAWHQIIAGERRVNCQECHNHNDPSRVPFEETAAARPDYQRLKLTKARTVEYTTDIQEIEQRTGLVIGNAPYKQPGGPQPFRSALWTLLDDPNLTPLEVRTLAAWADTGFLAANVRNDGSLITPESGQGPWADHNPPAMAGKAYADRLVVGVGDHDSGVDWPTLEIRDASGAVLPHTQSGDYATVAGEPAGRYVATIKDKQGNPARLVIDADGELPDPPDPSDCEERIRELEARILQLETKGAADAALIASLQAEVAALTAKINAIKEIVE